MCARASVEIVHVHRRFLSHSLIRTASLPLLSLSPPLSLSRPLTLSLSHPRPYAPPPSLSVVEMPGPVVWVEKEVFVEKQVFVEKMVEKEVFVEKQVPSEARVICVHINTSAEGERRASTPRAGARAHAQSHIHTRMQVMVEVVKEIAAPKRRWFRWVFPQRSRTAAAAK